MRRKEVRKMKFVFPYCCERSRQNPKIGVDVTFRAEDTYWLKARKGQEDVWDVELAANLPDQGVRDVGVFFCPHCGKNLERDLPMEFVKRLNACFEDFSFSFDEFDSEASEIIGVASEI